MAVSETSIQERRKSTREAVVFPAKIYDLKAEKYFTAETCNVSGTGVLLKVNRSMPVASGDVFDIAITLEKSGPVISRKGMTNSQVVRVIPIDRFTQAIAVTYKDNKSSNMASRQKAAA